MSINTETLHVLSGSRISTAAWAHYRMVNQHMATTDSTAALGYLLMCKKIRTMCKRLWGVNCLSKKKKE